MSKQKKQPSESGEEEAEAGEGKRASAPLLAKMGLA